jgi:hypothetical protein
MVSVSRKPDPIHAGPMNRPKSRGDAARLEVDLQLAGGKAVGGIGRDAEVAVLAHSVGVDGDVGHPQQALRLGDMGDLEG